MPIIPVIVADYGKDGAEVNGIFCGDDGRFAVTVATKVSAAQVLRDIAGAREIAAFGHLDQSTVTGDSGEVYRMIIGTVAAWRVDDEADAR